LTAVAACALGSPTERVASVRAITPTTTTGARRRLAFIVGPDRSIV
jgi:hypothetical protein